MTSFKEKVDIFKAWIRTPLKMLHILWFICLAISVLCMLALLSGWFDHKLTRPQYEQWFEANIQIIILLLTIMCLYQHPRSCYHLFLLRRWKPEDVSKLRKLFCRNGKEKPHERKHMTTIVVLFQVHCFAQYIVCALHWGYSFTERPMGVVRIAVLIAVSSVVIAAIYKAFGPLQKKDDDSDVDEEAPAPEPYFPKA